MAAARKAVRAWSQRAKAPAAAVEVSDRPEQSAISAVDLSVNSHKTTLTLGRSCRESGVDTGFKIPELGRLLENSNDQMHRLPRKTRHRQRSDCDGHSC